MSNYGELSQIDSKARRRFEAKFVKGDPDECWEWIASRNQGGYGLFWYKYHHVGAHRIVWLLAYGEIPSGLEVCHKCDNPSCVNPEHLFLGTRYDNVSDMYQKGRGQMPMQFLGYGWNKGSRRWCAYIRADGKMIGLGSYLFKEQAAYARKLAEDLKKKGERIDGASIRERVRKGNAR